MKQVIAVLGMHRSGTSALMRGLRVFGVDLGDDLLPAAADNQKGFWEHKGINALNEELLRALGMNWYSLRPMDQVEREIAAPYKDKAKELLLGHLKCSDIFGFKDPRVCRLLPFWLEVFGELGVEDKYVISVRNPVSVAASLEKRNAFAPAKSYLMWLEHVIPAMLLPRKKPRLVVDYDLLLREPEVQMRRIGGALGLKADPDDLAYFLDDFLEKGLSHAHYKPEDVAKEPKAMAPLGDAYKAMLLAAADKVKLDDANFIRRFKRYETRLGDYDSMLELLDVFEQRGDDLDAEVERRGHHIKHLETMVQVKATSIAALEADKTALEQRIEGLEATVAGHEQHITGLHAAINERDALIQGLHRRIFERDQLLDQMRGSKSWRLTAPLRFTRELLKNPKQALSSPRRLAYGVLRWCYHLIPLPERFKRPLADGLRKGVVGFKTFRYFLADKGGIKGVFRLGLVYYRQEGLQGLARRCKTVFRRETFGLGDLQSAQRLRGEHVVRRQAAVDVVVCVHNALDDVRLCLNSVVCHTLPPYQIIVVDDGSGEETRDFLRSFMEGQPGRIIRNEQAQGYTHAANIGMRASSAPYVVLLNSDTVVTERWLDRMVQCMESDPLNGLVGPLSNTASWQSVPEVFEACNGDWNCNDLPQGWGVDDMAAAVSSISRRSFPEVGILNGFCMLLRRELFDSVGYFDEETFAGGFGEENDYCLRVGEAGWKLAVADDCYIFHAQSKSYSHERRKKLVRRSDAALSEKHGRQAVLDALDKTKDHPVLHSMRARTRVLPARHELLRECRRNYEGKRILFLLFVSIPGGGSNIILRESQALRDLGADVHIANHALNKTVFERFHPHLDLPVVYLDTPADLVRLGERYDAVVSTLFLTVDWMVGLTPLAEAGKLTLGYYVQDYEPHFFDQADPHHLQAVESYTKIPSMRVFTKTIWNQEELRKHTTVEAEVVGPSFDWSLFFPTFHKLHSRPVVVTAMVRPSTPRRAPALTMRVLKRLKDRYQDRVEVLIFGVTEGNPEFVKIAPRFKFQCCGELPSGHVAELLDRSHIFLDLSTYQAMGLTALEAMACGVAVVGPINGGLKEIVTSEKDGLLIDTTDEEACFQAACRLVDDQWFRFGLQSAAVTTAAAYYPEKVAARILEVLFGSQENP